MYDFQRKHGHDIDCHVLAPASTCSNTRASTCITTRASRVLNGASTCSNTCASTCITTRASTCITTRASTCHYTRARLLFKNMRPGPDEDILDLQGRHGVVSRDILSNQQKQEILEQSCISLLKQSSLIWPNFVSAMPNISN